jgi:hypothetical protein
VCTGAKTGPGETKKQARRAALDARPQAAVGDISVGQHMGELIAIFVCVIPQQCQQVGSSCCHLPDFTQEPASADLTCAFSA